jgi:hypothetical protein
VKRLTDEELAEIQNLNNDVFRNGSECGSTAEKLCERVDVVLMELKHLRELLATPMPKHDQTRHLVSTADPDGWINIPGVGCWRPEVAVAFAAQIIRTALQAKEGDRE